MVPHTAGWTLPHQSSVKMTLHRHGQKPIWSGQFLNGRLLQKTLYMSSCLLKLTSTLSLVQSSIFPQTLFSFPTCSTSIGFDTRMYKIIQPSKTGRGGWPEKEQRTHCQVKCFHWHLRFSLQRVLIRTAPASEVWVFPQELWAHPAWGPLCINVTFLPASTHISLFLKGVEWPCSKAKFPNEFPKGQRELWAFGLRQLSPWITHGEAILAFTVYCF